MAIRYLYPIPEPIYIPPDLPEGFKIDPELEAKLKADARPFEAFIKDLGNHQIFTRPKGQEQWDAILLALEERAARREKEPDQPDYLALPGAAAEILKTCVNEPMFLMMVENEQGPTPTWVRGLPFFPRQVRAFRPFIEAIKASKDVKPARNKPSLVEVPAEATESEKQTG